MLGILYVDRIPRKSAGGAGGAGAEAPGGQSAAAGLLDVVLTPDVEACHETVGQRPSERGTPLDIFEIPVLRFDSLFAGQSFSHLNLRFTSTCRDVHCTPADVDLHVVPIGRKIIIIS